MSVLWLGSAQDAGETFKGNKGTVNFFDARNGSGSIAPEDGGKDIFVYNSGVSGGLLQAGDKVMYSVIYDAETQWYKAIHVIGGTKFISVGKKGTVNFFDARKGSGSIAPEHGGTDIFVYNSGVSGGLLQAGDKVTYSVIYDPETQWYKAINVIGGTKFTSVGKKGTVKFFNARNGSGSIAPEDGGKDIFVYNSGVSGGLLQAGDKVMYSVIYDQETKGYKAINVIGGTKFISVGNKGTVIFFDARNGSGHIAPEDGGKDILVYNSGVSGGLFHKGDKVMYSVIDDPETKRYKAINVIGGTIISEGNKGTVIFFNARNGSGSIAPEDGVKEIFVYNSGVSGGLLQAGDKVMYSVIYDPERKWNKAVNVIGVASTTKTTSTSTTTTTRTTTTTTTKMAVRETQASGSIAPDDGGKDISKMAVRETQSQSFAEAKI